MRTMQPFHTGISGISRVFVVIAAKSFEEIFRVKAATRAQAWKCPRLRGLLREPQNSYPLAPLCGISGISGVNSRGNVA